LPAHFISTSANPLKANLPTIELIFIFIKNIVLELGSMLSIRALKLQVHQKNNNVQETDLMYNSQLSFFTDLPKKRN
jgi:hypothetical protein